MITDIFYNNGFPSLNTAHIKSWQFSPTYGKPAGTNQISIFLYSSLRRRNNLYTIFARFSAANTILLIQSIRQRQCLRLEAMFCIAVLHAHVNAAEEHGTAVPLFS